METAVAANLDLTAPEGQLDQVAVDQDGAVLDIVVDGCDAETGAVVAGSNDNALGGVVVPVGGVGAWSADVEPMGV